MTANIHTQNGWVLNGSSYGLLTPDERAEKDGSVAQKQFMARVHEKLGSQVLPRELEEIGLENTPQHD